MQNSKLNVDFHESGFASAMVGENQQVLQKGFWFQLSGQDQAKTDVFGPDNPQALSRYSYVLDNPLRYIDSTGHYHIYFNHDMTSVQIVFSKQDMLKIQRANNHAAALEAILAGVYGVIAGVLAISGIGLPLVPDFLLGVAFSAMLSGIAWEISNVVGDMIADNQNLTAGCSLDSGCSVGSVPNGTYDESELNGGQASCVSLLFCETQVELITGKHRVCLIH